MSSKISTKEQEAKERSENDYEEYEYLVTSNYNVDDIDYEVLEKAIKESIYEAYMVQLYLDGDEDGEDSCFWRIDDYDVLESDIMDGIRKKLKLEE